MNTNTKAGYKNLIVYEKSKKLSVDIFKYFSKQKHTRMYEFLIIQLLRCVSSIGANIAEGYGRHYKKSYRNHLSIARGSCFETQHWLEVAIELKKFDNEILEKFLEVNSEVAKMLTVMMRKIEHTK